MRAKQGVLGPYLCSLLVAKTLVRDAWDGDE